MKKVAGLVACLCCLSLSNVAQSAEFIAGVENVRFRTGVDTDPAGAVESTVYHSWTAFRGDWLINENFTARVQAGGITTTLEDPTFGTETNDNGFYLGGGMTMNQNLDSGGGMLIDVGFGWAKNDFANAEYTHLHTAAKFAYAFGEKGTAQPYFGYSYNTYQATYAPGTGPDADFTSVGNHNFLVGVRALTESFNGIMEATLGFEVGVLLALEFGF